MSDMTPTLETPRLSSVVDAATSVGIAITGNASLNTKGSWTQLIASLPFDVAGVLVTGKGANATNEGLLDIGVGAAASEQVLIPNLFIEGTGTSNAHANAYVPVEIPAGSRVAARYQDSQITSAPMKVSLILLGAGFAMHAPFGGCDDIGSVASFSRGTTLTGGSANVKGAWAQLIASTARDYRALIPMLGAGATSLTDIGVGAAAAEQIVIPDLPQSVASGSYGNIWPPIPIEIPAGSRIAGRTQTTGASGTIYLSLLGLY